MSAQKGLRGIAQHMSLFDFSFELLLEFESVVLAPYSINSKKDTRILSHEEKIMPRLYGMSRRDARQKIKAMRICRGKCRRRSSRPYFAVSIP